MLYEVGRERERPCFWTWWMAHRMKRSYQSGFIIDSLFGATDEDVTFLICKLNSSPVITAHSVWSGQWTLLHRKDRSQVNIGQWRNMLFTARVSIAGSCAERIACETLHITAFSHLYSVQTTFRFWVTKNHTHLAARVVQFVHLVNP